MIKYCNITECRLSIVKKSFPSVYQSHYWVLLTEVSDWFGEDLVIPHSICLQEVRNQAYQSPVQPRWSFIQSLSTSAWFFFDSPDFLAQEIQILANYIWQWWYTRLSPCTHWAATLKFSLWREVEWSVQLIITTMVVLIYYYTKCKISHTYVSQSNFWTPNVK